MGSNKTIAINTILVLLRLIVVGVLELWLVQLSLKALGVDSFGIYNVVGGVVLLFNLINTAMSTTSYRYIAVEIGKKGNPNKMFCISMMIYAALCVGFLLLAETIGLFYINNYLVVAESMRPDAVFVFQLSILTAIISMLMIPYQGVLLAVENFKAKIVAEVAGAITKVLGVIWMINGDIDSLRIYSIIMLVAVVVRAIVNYLYCVNKYHDIIKIKIYRDWKLCKEMLFFNNWILLGTGVSAYKSNGIAIVINYFFGTTLNAAFAVANRIQTSIGMFAGNLNTAAIPQIMKNFGGGNLERTGNLVNYISKYSFFLMFAISLPLYCQLPYILELWLDVIPPYTLEFSQIVIVLCLFEGLGKGIPALVQATGKIKWFQICSSTIHLMGLPISFVLYMYGAPPSTILIILCCTTLFSALSDLILLRLVVKFDIRRFVMTSYVRALLVLVGIIPFIYVSNIVAEKNFFFLIAISIISELYLCVTIYFLGLETRERKLLWDYALRTKEKIIRRK